MKVFIAAGTRPEAIKLAPVVQVLRRGRQVADTLLCATGQHTDLLVRALDMFRLTADVNLDVMTPNQGLADLTARILQDVTPVMARFRPDWVVVQGDTTTSMAAALATF